MCMPAPTHKPAVNNARWVCQSQVTNVDLREVTGDGELGSRDAAIEDKAKLSMMCWNVCGWCKEGGRIEQMREEHDIRAEVINLYRPDVVALVQAWL